MWSRVTILVGICLLAVAAQSFAERVRYDNYNLYRINPANTKHLEILKELQESSDSLIFLEEIQVTGKDLGVIVAPHKKHDLEQVLANKDIQYELIEKNFQNILDEEIAENLKADTSGYTRDSTDNWAYGWSKYYTLQETYTWLLNLTSRFPSQVLPIDAGVSYERRRILGIKISLDKGKTEKPAIFIEGGIHAREWVSPATVTYIADQLLRSDNAAIKSIANKYDWYIVPHANPDGYVYTHTTNRLWRKTRSPQGTCFGTDPNRNWDFHWAEAGTSSNPCSETYPGSNPFSEIETLSLARYISSIKDKIKVYLAFHSYSQLLLFPYGHTSEKCPNHDDLDQIYKVTVNALKQRYGTEYTGGNIHDAIYPASGASIEWVYGQGINVTYTYELRPKSSSVYGFRLPADKILPTAEETMDSVVALVNEAERLGYFK